MTGKGSAAGARDPRQVCVLLELMGEQPTPNLIPALAYRPDEVVFIVSERTAPHARHTQAALRMVPALARTPSRLETVDAYDIAATERTVEQVLARYPNGHFIFNVTGGTKPMMIGMYRAASAERWRGRARMVYVSTERETEQTIVDGECRERPLTLRVPVEVYLRAHGVTVGAGPAPFPRSWEAVAVELARMAEDDARVGRPSRKLSQMLASIHRAAKGMKDQQLRERSISLKRGGVRLAGRELLHRCQSASILSDLVVGREEISFRLSGARALSFLKGGWLEVYVAAAARRMEVFHQVLVHVPIVHPRWGHKELDVVAMRGVVPVICSCKAGRVPQGSACNAPLDELEARSRALGRYCGKAFVASQVGHSDDFVARAAGMGIHVVRSQDLTAVGDLLVEASHSKGHLRMSIENLIR